VNGQRNPGGRRWKTPPRARGFTIIEIVVAMTVAVFALGASITAWPKLYQAMEYRDAVRGVIGAMNAARAEAVRTGLPAVFFVDLDTRCYGVGEKVRGCFPDTVTVRYILAGREVDERGRGQIRFSPAGGATGGSVDLLRGAEGGARLRVDWLFGTVEQEALPPGANG
jgi:general secretion pathway protein H